jgi:hypothetical protein
MSWVGRAFQILPLKQIFDLRDWTWIFQATEISLNMDKVGQAANAAALSAQEYDQRQQLAANRLKKCSANKRARGLPSWQLQKFIHIRWLEG